MHSTPPLRSYARTLKAAIRAATREAHINSPNLLIAMNDHVSRQVEEPNASSRLFAMLVGGAAGDDPRNALQVSVLSCFWWAGVDADNIGSATLMALQHLTSQRITTELHKAWTGDLLRSTIEITEFRLTELSLAEAGSEKSAPTNTSTHRSAFARDAVMAIRTIDHADPLKWREFGALYGTFMELAAANTREDRPRTSTLLLKHALSASSEHRRRHLLALSKEANSDSRAMAILHELACSPSATTLYAKDIDALHDRARKQLIELCEPGPYRTVLLGKLSTLWRQAHVRPREVLGTTQVDQR